ncbi:MAG: tRNA (guanosine(37)-N1)-methyltransferase TrmD [Patescibacteria group bacterium]|jgi:tRNA (guanine37-N1)-methyltransferase
MRFDLLTIFPDIFSSYINESILKLAQQNQHIKINVHNIRDYSKERHHKTDDVPYGGGPGMVMTVQPIYDCLKAVPRLPRSRVIMLDPGGTEYTQITAKKYSEQYEQIILLCGRYEGFDERVYNFVDERVSIGKYVLSGGELAALIIVETVSRLLPGVLGDDTSSQDETFSGNLNYVEYPQYTRPEHFITTDQKTLSVPPILLSGNHAQIKQWRKDNQKKI